jgi:type IV pilus assembly protein PilW
MKTPMRKTLHPRRHARAVPRSLSTQTGFTLVELMVAMIIGLLLIAGASGVYLATRTLGRTQDASSITQDYGNYTINQITRGVQRAGYVDWLASSNNYTAAFNADTANTFEHKDASKRDAFHMRFGGATGVTGNIPTVPTTSAVFGCEGASPASGGYSCGGSATYSGMSIAYQSLALAGANDYSPSLSAISVGSDGATDCNGQRPDNAVPPMNYIVNRYYVDANKQLMCLGNGNANTAQPIASNVTDFKVLYGLAATGTENPTQWVDATKVTNWALVTSLQLCLGLEGASGSAPNPTTVIGCNGQSATLTNTKLRKYFRTTINLRNATFAAKALPV